METLQGFYWGGKSTTSSRTSLKPQLFDANAWCLPDTFPSVSAADHYRSVFHVQKRQPSGLGNPKHSIYVRAIRTRPTGHRACGHFIPAIAVEITIRDLHESNQMVIVRRCSARILQVLEIINGLGQGGYEVLSSGSGYGAVFT
jgi:hypothetical protein